jgi:YD repeat-containing protein
MGLELSWLATPKGGTDAQSHVTSYAYDSHGNRTSVTDSAGNVTTFAYDAGDRLTTITDAASNVTIFGYDAIGNPSGSD